MFNRKIANSSQKLDIQNTAASLGSKPAFYRRLLEHVANRLENARAVFSLATRKTITGVAMVATIAGCSPITGPSGPVDIAFDNTTKMLGFGQDTIIGKYRITGRYLLPKSLTDSTRVADVFIDDTTSAYNHWEYWLTRDSMVTAYAYTKVDSTGTKLDSIKAFHFKCLDIVDSSATYVAGAAKFRIWRDW